jgi:hypothetical protein
MCILFKKWASYYTHIRRTCAGRRKLPKNSDPFNLKDNKFPTLNHERDLGEGGSLPCLATSKTYFVSTNYKWDDFSRGRKFWGKPQGRGHDKNKGARDTGAKGRAVSLNVQARGLYTALSPRRKLL